MTTSTDDTTNVGTANERIPSLEHAFRTCQFSPTLVYLGSGPHTAIRRQRKNNEQNWTITSFFADSSGRSSFSLPLQLKFMSKKHLDVFLQSGCIDPVPTVVDNNQKSPPQADENKSDGETAGGDENTDQVQKQSGLGALLGFEVKTKCPDNEKGDTKNNKSSTVPVVVVEGVSIESTRVDDLTISFDTKVTVRVTNACQSSTNNSNNNNAKSGIKTKLLVMPVLDFPPTTTLVDIPLNQTSQPNKDMKKKKLPSRTSLVPDFMALELTSLPDSTRRDSIQNVSAASSTSAMPSFIDRGKKLHLPKVPIDVTLTHAFDVDIRTVGGGLNSRKGFNNNNNKSSSDGTTMISVSIQHSNSHPYPVSITNITLHPGHSRTGIIDTHNNNNNNNSNTKTGITDSSSSEIVNMTQSVQVRYPEKTGLDLPLTLHPYETYSTVLSVIAGEEMHSRVFACPLSVTGAIVLDHDVQADKQDEKESEPTTTTTGCSVVVSGEAHWSTVRVAVEPEDAFRLEINAPDFVVERGKPITVSVRIFNLNIETRNVMLLVSKERHVSSPKKTSPDNSANTAVVSEAHGYTFGVWGIAEGDDGTAKLHRDADLLSIDSALVLGDVQGQHAVDAELRFVPLRLGLIPIPDLKIYDQTAKRWYNCSHSLSVVSKELEG